MQTNLEATTHKETKLPDYIRCYLHAVLRAKVRGQSQERADVASPPSPRPLTDADGKKNWEPAREMSLTSSVTGHSRNHRLD